MAARWRYHFMGSPKRDMCHHPTPGPRPIVDRTIQAREQVNDTDQLLLRVIEPDIVQDRRRCIRNTEYTDATSNTALLAES